MKLVLILIGWGGFLNPGSSQSREIDTRKINKLQVMELRCLDTAGCINNLCPLGLDGLQIEFYRAFLNQNKRELRLVGRCLAGGGIDIFKASTVGNKMISKYLIAETSEDPVNINQDGFFDVTIKVDKKESLFFHESMHFLREFRVGKLFGD